MVERAWDDTFITVLRKHLKLLAADDPLAPDASLVELGLDSLEMVGLLIDLESVYGISFPDSEMNFETFASAERLWAVVARLRAAG
ncbi:MULTISPECIES: phosphopantetheine-binding protein [Polymorphospora]|uniref:Phosphopantetheine-binding protein n=1 Tax=Polymorphospora lycopeni TaxID=3140240 RepID=A0ABV5CVT7_9ACTN